MSRANKSLKGLTQEELESSLFSWISVKTSGNNREEVIECLKQLKRELIQIRERGGYTLIDSDGCQITIYRNSNL